MAILDSSFPKKGDEENKIPVDIINDDMALSEAFKKMTINEKEDSALNNGDGDGDKKNNGDGDGDKKKKSLINSIGGAFSSIATKLESNIGKVLEDPNKRALFYSGMEMIDKSSRMVPLSSGRAQSPFGIITGSLGSGVKAVKAEELAADAAKAKLASSGTKSQIDMLKLQFDMDKPGAMELDAYKGLDKQMEDIASATKLNQVFGSQKNIIKSWAANPDNNTLPVGALRSKFPTFLQSINDLLPQSMRQENEFFTSIESSANFINSFNKLSTVATLDTLSNTKLTPVSDRDVKIVREGQTQTTDAATTFLNNIIYTDAISLIESEKIKYARLFKQDRGYKTGSNRDFDTEFTTIGSTKLRDKILKESSHSPDKLYEEAKLLGFAADYEKYTGDVTDFSPFALASAKASLDMGGKTQYSRFYNSTIPIEKDKNKSTTPKGEPLDGEKWQENYPGVNEKIESMKPKTTVKEDPFETPYDKLSPEIKKRFLENDISPEYYNDSVK